MKAVNNRYQAGSRKQKAGCHIDRMSRLGRPFFSDRRTFAMVNETIEGAGVDAVRQSRCGLTSDRLRLPIEKNAKIGS